MKLSRRTILKSLVALVPASLIEKPAIGSCVATGGYLDETIYNILLSNIKISDYIK